MIWLAQVTADELASADTTKLLAIIVIALVGVVVTLGALLVKVNHDHKKDLKAEATTYRKIWGGGREQS